MPTATKQRRSSHLIAMILAACLAAFGLLVSPLATGKAHAADCPWNPEGCISFISGVDNSSVIDVYGGWTNSGAMLQIYGPNGGDNQHFHLVTFDDGTFEIRTNLSSGLCFGNNGNNTIGWTYIGTVTCTGSDDQKWYFQPATNGGYLIRQVDSNGIYCLSADTQHGNLLIRYYCQGDKTQSWNIYDASQSPITNGPIYRQLAVQYAVSRCANSASVSYCQWKTAQTSSTVSGAPACMHMVNNTGSSTSTPMTYTEAEQSVQSTTVGTAIKNETTFKAELSATAGEVPLSATVGNQWSSSWEKTFAQTTGTTSTYTKTVNPTVPAYQSGWVVEVPQTKTLTGSYTFDPGGSAPWTYNGSITVPLGSGSSGSGTSTWYVGTGLLPPSVCGVPQETGKIVSNVSGGPCIDDSSNWTNSGNPIISYTCNGTSAQQWTSHGDGSLTVHGKCMDITGGGTANGTKVELWDCTGGGNQKWFMTLEGRLRNPQSGKCLDIPGSVVATQLQIWDCVGGSNQKWSMLPS